MKSLNDHLMDIVQKYQISKADRKSYASDAQHIQNTIMDGMRKHDSRFKETFRGLTLTGSYLDDIKLEIPDEFDLHMQLELPFKLSVEKDTKRSGYVFLRAKTKSNYPFFDADGFLNRKLLQKWLRENFSVVIKNIGEIQCRTGRTYQLKYTQHGEGCVHTIEATDKRQPTRQMSFDFVPVFEFPRSQLPNFENVPSEKCSLWFAMPQARIPRDERTFIVCSPDWECTDLPDKQKLKDALRLTKALKVANNMPNLKNYMLKTIVLNALKELEDSFWSTSLSNILIQIFNRLVNSLEEARLVYFLVPEVNHFERLNSREIKEYHQTAERLMSCLQRYNNSGRCVEYEDVAKLFKLT